MIRNNFCISTTKDSQRGATTVEFSIIAALLLVILFGIIEYAMIFLQEHYIANAAREAVRIGVRANNYNSYKTFLLPTAATKTQAGDREFVIKNAVADYLNTLYDEDESRNGTSVLMVDPDGNLATDTDRTLIVTVEVDNLFTSITPRLLLLLGAGDAESGPTKIKASAQMELEDQEEFDIDKVDPGNGIFSY